MKMNMIEIEVSWDDYKKIMSLDEFDIERKILQTSAAQYIRISLQPERTNPEDTRIKTYRRSDDGIYDKLEPCICDVPNTENK